MGRNTLGPETPFGAARKVLAVSLVAVTASVPLAVNGDPLTVNHEGNDNPTEFKSTAHPVALPFEMTPVGAEPVAHSVGVAPSDAALPVVLWFRVGMSAATIARKTEGPAEPFGAARNVFALSEVAVIASTPLATSGEFETVNQEGNETPTEVRPLPPPDPQALPVVDSIPPVPVCTHCPAARPVSVTADTVMAGEPVKPAAAVAVAALPVVL